MKIIKKKFILNESYTALLKSFSVVGRKLNMYCETHTYTPKTCLIIFIRLQ